jgi:diphthamide synthase (EF-2-diphthine--ammonia ligase)
MLAAGLRARLTCVDSHSLDGAFAGREFDAALLTELPAAVDPCGENGEFHTFCYAGPMLHAPINVAGGEIRTYGQFVYADLTLQ